jgi:threonylcarbamoyladenosine tRNA methylthiotransferase MtaB
VLGEDPVVRVEEFAGDEAFDSPLIDSFSGRSRAFVKIQDGCDLRCSYCTIWRARGPARSRPLAEVLAQISALLSAGYREMVLAGVHVGAYGLDRDERGALPALLRECCTQFPDARFRLSSIHPNEIGSELVDLLADRPQLRPHLHVSLQSGSDAVLRRMRRPYRSRDARAAILEAVRKLPHCGIGADLIVGFPGETDAEHAETERLIRELPFSYLHVFRFSPRPGTEAASRTERVHPETVSERSAALRGLGAAKRRAFARAQVGSVREAVLESPVANRSKLRAATTDNYLALRVPRAAGRPGDLVRVRLTAARGAELTGEIVESEAEAASTGHRPARAVEVEA